MTEPVARPMHRRAITAVLLDLGGVVSTDGFRDALKAVGARNGYDPDRFFETGRDALYASGYITGHARERDFWRALRAATPVAESDATLRAEVLARFAVRQPVLDWIMRMRRGGMLCALLTDQTDWLDALEQRDRFLGAFDRVFNSYRLGTSKRDPGTFLTVADRFGVRPRQILFVDDSEGHVRRARSCGLNGLLFRDPAPSLSRLQALAAAVVRAKVRDNPSAPTLRGEFRNTFSGHCPQTD